MDKVRKVGFFLFNPKFLKPTLVMNEQHPLYFQRMEVGEELPLFSKNQLSLGCLTWDIIGLTFRDGIDC